MNNNNNLFYGYNKKNLIYVFIIFILVIIISLFSYFYENELKVEDSFHLVQKKIRLRTEELTNEGSLISRFANKNDKTVYSVLDENKLTKLLKKERRNRYTFFSPNKMYSIINNNSKKKISNNVIRELLIRVEHESSEVAIPLLIECFKNAYINNWPQIIINDEDSTTLTKLRDNIYYFKRKYIKSIKYYNKFDEMTFNETNTNENNLLFIKNSKIFIKQIYNNLTLIVNHQETNLTPELDNKITTLKDIMFIKDDEYTYSKYKNIISISSSFIDKVLAIYNLCPILNSMKEFWDNELSKTLAVDETLGDPSLKNKESKYPPPTDEQLKKSLKYLQALEIYTSSNLQANELLWNIFLITMKNKN